MLGGGGEVGARRSERPGTSDLDTYVTPLAQRTGRTHCERQEDCSRPPGAGRSASAASDNHAHSDAG